MDRPAVIEGQTGTHPDVAAGESNNRRIRVLWLIKGLGRGGAEMLLYHAAELRDREGFDCEVAYLLGSRSWLADDLRSLDVPVHLLDSEKHADLRWTLRLRRLIADRRYDIVHVHSPLVAGFARLTVRTLPRRIRPLTISTEHLLWSGHARWTRALNRATFRLDRTHVAVSRAVVDSIPPRLRDGVHVLIHGIPLERTRTRRAFRNEVRRELGVAEDEFLVGTVANFTHQKGYPTLLEAARILTERGARVRFVAAGRGPLLEDVRRQVASLGLSDRFTVLGPVEDAPRLMSGFDVFALASHWEGLPLVVMEAKGIGLPIVATRVGGVPELVRHEIDGILVGENDAPVLADALGMMASDPRRRAAMAEAAAEDAARLDNVAAVRSIERLYAQLASTQDAGRWR